MHLSADNSDLFKGDGLASLDEGIYELIYS